MIRELQKAMCPEGLVSTTQPQLVWPGYSHTWELLTSITELLRKQSPRANVTVTDRLHIQQWPSEDGTVTVHHLVTLQCTPCLGACSSHKTMATRQDTSQREWRAQGSVQPTTRRSFYRTRIKISRCP